MHCYKIEYGMDTPYTNNITFTSVGNVIYGLSLSLKGVTLDVINSLVIYANNNSMKISGIAMRILNMTKENIDPDTVFINFPVVLLYKFYANITLTLNYDISLFTRSDGKMKQILNEYYIEDISNIILEYGTYGSIGEIVLNTTDIVSTHERYTEYEVNLCSNVNVISLDLKKDSFNNIVIAFINDGKFMDILASCTLDDNVLSVTIKNNIHMITNIPDGCSLLKLDIEPQQQVLCVHVITY